MKRLFHIAVCLCLCACVGCAARSKKNKSKTAQATQQPAHLLVGTITVVNEEQRFVLIDTESANPAEVGTALKCFSNGVETAVLTVSPERKESFMIADIVTGTPHKGDQVFE